MSQDIHDNRLSDDQLIALIDQHVVACLRSRKDDPYAAEILGNSLRHSKGDLFVKRFEDKMFACGQVGSSALAAELLRDPDGRVRTFTLAVIAEKMLAEKEARQ